MHNAKSTIHGTSTAESGIFGIFAGMKKLLAYVLPALAALYIMAGSLLTLPDYDDAFYAFVQGDDPAWNDHPAGMRPVETLADVAESQYHHYLDVNGRAPVHVLVQVFIGVLGRQVFAVANALVFVLVVWLLCRYELPRRQRGPLLFLVNMLAMLLLFPARDTNLAMWASPAYSINYLWVMLAVLVFLLLVRRTERGGRVPVAVCVVAGLLTGWSNEAFAVPLGAAMLVVWLWRRLRFRNVAQGALCVSLWAATLPLVLSPGTLHRASTANGVGSLYDFVCRTYECFAGITMLYVLLVCAGVYLVFRRRECVAFVRANGMLWLLWLVELMFVSVAHSYPHSMCLLEFLSLMLVVRLAERVRPGVFAGHTAVAACGAAVFAVLAVWATVVSVRIREDALEMGERLKTAPDGCTYVEVQEVCPAIRPLTIAPLRGIEPQGFPGSSMMILYAGRHDRLPMVVSREDYEGLYSPEFPGALKRLPGTAKALEGRDHYYIMCDSLPQGGAGVRDVCIRYGGRDLGLRSPLKRMLYAVTGNGPYTQVVAVDTFTAAGRRLLVAPKRFADPVEAIDIDVE